MDALPAAAVQQRSRCDAGPESLPPYLQHAETTVRQGSSDSGTHISPPPYAPNNHIRSNDASRDYIVGDQHVWYRGVRYSTDMLWKSALAMDPRTLQKCLKAGLSGNLCRWTHGGVGVRSIADLLAANNSIESMRSLIEYGVDLSGNVVAAFAADPRCRNRTQHNDYTDNSPENDMWTTPLHEACQKGHVDMVGLLLDKGHVSPHVLNGKQQTGLCVALECNHTAVVRRLLMGGAVIGSDVGEHVTPLATAASNGSPELVEILLHHGVKVDVANARGETALFSAAYVGHHGVISKLVAYGADVDARNLAGLTAFFTAASRFKMDTMICLVEHGAQLDAPDANGCTALLRSVMAGNIALTEYLLRLGADIDRPDDQGWTPLFVAMIRRHDILIHLLLENGCDVSKCDPHGNTPLHWAGMLGSVTVVRRILGHQRQSHSSQSHLQLNMHGETALMLACRYNHTGLVKILLDYGADPACADSNGFTALDRTIYGGNYACARLLLFALDPALVIHENAIRMLQASRPDGPASLSGKYQLIAKLLKDRCNIDVETSLESVVTSQSEGPFRSITTPAQLKARMRAKRTAPMVLNAELDAASAQTHSGSTNSADPFGTCMQGPSTGQSAS